ncbi:hypothetical protein VC178_08420 [Polynucleobacter sp. AP-Sanab-80-C2]|uniref:hypothetical protein n=1 Tax=Polynucleobacter sp. AP-Sanab-80-C2 TaxID=3108274 RepID=UPI002B22C580|nr:hypothetical protein [Polynucleobacter sp. AP-Sanab-80-C2]MEA9599911.1 hypothetical protein [Polynucleobacter sp. AP-Sanab-80-C2]
MNPTINDWATFLHSQGPFQWAITMNLKKRHPIYQTYITPQIFEQTGRHYLSLVNKGIFKRKYRYGRAKLNGIFCMEVGELEKRPHLHFAIGSDSESHKDALLIELNKACKKMDWIKGDIHVTPYQDSGWLNYLLKTGFNEVVLH